MNYLQVSWGGRPMTRSTNSWPRCCSSATSLRAAACRAWRFADVFASPGCRKPPRCWRKWMESLRLKKKNMDIAILTWQSCRMNQNSMILWDFHDIAGYIWIYHDIACDFQMMTLREGQKGERHAGISMIFYLKAGALDYCNLDSNIGRRWTGRNLQWKRFLFPARV